MIVAIDLDWTIADWSDYLVDAFYEKFGVYMHVSKGVSPIFLKYLVNWDNSAEIIENVWKMANKYKYILTDEDWPNVLKKITDRGCKVVLLTARNEEEANSIKSWLMKHNIIQYFSEFYFVREPEKKRLIKFDVLIDDELDNCLNAVKIGRKAIWYEPEMIVSFDENKLGGKIFQARDAYSVLRIISRIGGWDR